jgi:hypothetical protein
MLRQRIKRRLGSLVARALAGAWRESPPPVDFSASDLDAVVPLLLASGAGALGWQRVRYSTLRDTPAALRLQEAYRMHALHAAIHEAEIQQLFSLFRAAGVEPVLVKGWAVARSYARTWLRPYGDVDLCVRPEEYAAAAAQLHEPEARKFYVDLHEGFGYLDNVEADDLLARSRLIRLGDTGVRVLGVEDHLRILCLHFLRHGGWRPLWLCDIGTIIESLPDDFDWQRLLRNDPLRVNYIACVIELARRLLGANVERVPPGLRERRLPGWLAPHLLKTWGRAFPELYNDPVPMAALLNHPARFFSGVLRRWPDPIEAITRRQKPFDSSPRLLHQFATSFSRAGKFLLALPKAGRRR